MKKWQCSVCKYIHTGETPPDKCPVCGVSGKKFILLEETTDASVSEKAPFSAPAKASTEEKFKAPAKETVDEKSKAPAKASAAPSPAPATLYEKITGLMVQHHAHPISVHFPNGILPAAAVLFILAWLFNADLLVKAGFINLIFVVLALPLVLFSGFLEWKKKYNQAMTLIFKIKILAASLTASSCLILMVWFLMDPQVLSSSRAWVFILISVVMLASAGIAGHIGGKLVFKD